MGIVQVVNGLCVKPSSTGSVIGDNLTQIQSNIGF